MIAKHDVVVTDARGLNLHVFAGQTVPVELEGLYRQAVGEQNKQEAEKAQDAPEKDKAQAAPERDKAQKSPQRQKSARRSNNS